MAKSKSSGFSSIKSIGGKNVSATGQGGRIYVSGKPETRSDIRKLFISELGFKELYGTNEIPTAQLASLAIELKKHERKAHTLANNNVVLAATHKKGVKGAAADLGGGNMVMFVNPEYHTSVSGSRKVLKSEQRSLYKTKTNGKVTKDFTYTARHEYGHLTQFSYTNRTGKSASQIRSEVQSIARKKYGARILKNPSRYGAQNEYEYFAESFASMTGGKPNSHGKALRDWLRQHR
jgi:hypothetical protein